jgi:hypothetical protein
MAFPLSLSGASYQFRNSSSTPPPQDVTMQQTSQVNVFSSDYRMLAASDVISFVLLALLLPAFVGFQELGRDVSLNPIETATAFDAPIFRDLGSNATMGQLASALGARRARLGEVTGSGGRAGMGWTEYSGMDYQEPGATGRGEVRRLRIADPVDITAAPEIGAVYR